MADYDRLKWAHDERWTNIRKRGTYKALAEGCTRKHDDDWLADDEATAARLADVKKSTAALYRAIGHRDDVVGHLLPDTPLKGRAAYRRMESVAEAERSLREKLVRGRYQLDVCRQRVADKTAQLARLKARLALARDMVPRKPRRPPVLESALMLDKKIDALKLGNLQAAKACNMIADNMAMKDALNEQLASDIRQQASAMVELLAYGTAAKQEEVAYEQEYCRVAGEHEDSIRQNDAHSRILDTRISVLESKRRKMIIKQIHNDSDEGMEFVTGGTTPGFETVDTTSSIDSNFVYKPDERNLMLLKDWIDTGPMEKQFFPVDESEKEVSRFSDMTSLTDTIISYGYTFPEEKINRMKFKKGESSRAVEAVEYVCETLNFANITEVMDYITSVKNVEMRIKKMINTRKHIFGIVEENVEYVTEVKTHNVNCVPQEILKLDANIEHIQREVLEVQKKQLKDVNRNITGYNRLFNELWFQLDSLVEKLVRCQVPVVRKYQLHMKNRAKDSETMMDPRQMLEGLCLQHFPIVKEDCSSGQKLPEAESIDSTRGGCLKVDYVSGKNPAVDACRKLSGILYAKVKSCMVHVGGVFDPNDENQLMARACYAYDRQTQLQWDNDAVEDRARARSQRPKELKATTTDSKALGIMTREQTKQQSEDIVQYCITPRDTDEAKNTRKPISFRMSRIVVPERKKF